jgi:hypothetical protein
MTTTAATARGAALLTESFGAALSS